MVRGRRARQCTETAVSAEDSAMHAALDAESKTSSPPRPAGDLTSRGGARWLADGGGEGPGGTSARRLPADTRTSSTVAASINCLYQAHAVGGIVRATRTARASSERACDAKLALHAFQGGGGTQRPRERAGRKERASVQRTAFAIVTQVAFLISLFFFSFPSCAFPSARPWLTGADDFRRGRHANTTPRARRVNAHRSDLTARRQQVRRRMPSPRDFSASRQRERERERSERGPTEPLSSFPLLFSHMLQR